MGVLSNLKLPVWLPIAVLFIGQSCTAPSIDDCRILHDRVVGRCVLWTHLPQRQVAGAQQVPIRDLCVCVNVTTSHDIDPTSFSPSLPVSILQTEVGLAGLREVSTDLRQVAAAVQEMAAGLHSTQEEVHHKVYYCSKYIVAMATYHHSKFCYMHHCQFYLFSVTMVTVLLLILQY